MSLFNNYNDKAYKDTTDPFDSILEGPKFHFGQEEPTAQEEEEGELGRALGGAPTRSKHSLTPEELEHQRTEANTEDLFAKNPLSKDEKSDLELEADTWLSGENGHDSYYDALNHVEDIGEFDIAETPESFGDDETFNLDTNFKSPSFSISGREIVTPQPEAEELDSDEQFGLENPEGVLGNEEEEVNSEEVETASPSGKNLAALSKISDEDLIKEIQYRLGKSLGV